MKIVRITNTEILFDTKDRITYDHLQDCCEHNYADFQQIDDVAKETIFENPLSFEPVPDYGFRFGNKNKMFFVPCYSDQNGYYSSDVDIYYNDKLVLSTSGEMRD